LELSKDAKIAVILGGILVVVSTFPQVVQTLVTGLTRDINLYLIIFAIVGIGSYVYYAVRTRQWIFAIADGIDCIMWSIVLVMKVNNIINGTDNL
jgi:uncharacterized protein with PQ loop repeat